MCLAVPMRVIEISGGMGKLEAGGVTRQVSLALLEHVEPGDYVLVHAGFAIERLDQDQARATLDLLNDMLETRFATVNLDPLRMDLPQACYGLEFPYKDRDADTLNDCEEKLIGTDHTLFDTDRDGYPDQVEFRIRCTCRDLGTAGHDEWYGWGLVNAYSALHFPV